MRRSKRKRRGGNFFQQVNYFPSFYHNLHTFFINTLSYSKILDIIQLYSIHFYRGFIINRHLINFNSHSIYICWISLRIWIFYKIWIFWPFTKICIRISTSFCIFTPLTSRFFLHFGFSITFAYKYSLLYSFLWGFLLHFRFSHLLTSVPIAFLYKSNINTRTNFTLICYMYIQSIHILTILLLRIRIHIIILFNSNHNNADVKQNYDFNHISAISRPIFIK